MHRSDGMVDWVSPGGCGVQRERSGQAGEETPRNNNQQLTRWEWELGGVGRDALASRSTNKVSEATRFGVSKSSSRHHLPSDVSTIFDTTGSLAEDGILQITHAPYSPAAWGSLF